MGYTFFSEQDLDPKTGKPRGEYPSWYNPRAIYEMEDKIAQMEFAAENGHVPKGYMSEHMDILHQLKENLKKAKDLTFVEDGKNDRDKLDKAVKEGIGLWKDASPSVNYMESRRQLVDANEEYRRMATPCINVKSMPNFVEVMQACKIDIPSNGMVSREQIAKACKIGLSYLGENANLERFRKMK